MGKGGGLANNKRMLRIGVDVSMLSDQQQTGVGRYTYEILSRVVSMGHEWFLYSYRPLAVGNWMQKNVHLHIGQLPKSMMRMLWLQTAVPVMAARDKVDVFWSPTHRLPSMLPRRIARVVTIHDLVWKHAGETMRPFSRWLDATLMPEAVRIADRVIANSAHTAKDVLSEMPYAEGKLSQILLGVSNLAPAGEFSSLKVIGLDAPYFLFVGTLEPRKNLAGLIEAYSRLPEELKNCALLAIVGGKGWGGVDVAAVAEKFDVQDRIWVLGYVSDEQLATLYEHAMFLAMPSFYEGFGLPLLEAMSRGTPVLTSNFASMPEVAGDAGLLVDPHDIDSITRALRTFLGDETFVRNLGLRAIINAQRFSWELTAQQTLHVIEDAVQSHKK
jgi:glycosyltransferase involved in cell wall biosynthesis